jgi:hypothetical protein
LELSSLPSCFWLYSFWFYRFLELNLECLLKLLVGIISARFRFLSHFYSYFWELFWGKTVQKELASMFFCFYSLLCWTLSIGTWILSELALLKVVRALFWRLGRRSLPCWKVQPTWGGWKLKVPICRDELLQGNLCFKLSNNLSCWKSFLGVPLSANWFLLILKSAHHLFGYVSDLLYLHQ